MLHDVVDERLNLRVLGLWRHVQRLRDFEPLLEVAPAHLVDGQQRSTFVLSVVGDNHAHEESQTFDDDNDRVV